MPKNKHEYIVDRVYGFEVYRDFFVKRGELLTVEQVDKISYKRALEVQGETTPLRILIDGQEVWSYKDNRGIDLRAKYAK